MIVADTLVLAVTATTILFIAALKNLTQLSNITITNRNGPQIEVFDDDLPSEDL